MQSRNLWAMVAILLMFAGIAASRINADALWLDEEGTYAIIGAGRYGDGASLSGLFEYMGKIGETTPPLYYLTLAGWGRIAGWSPFAMRFLSVLWGVLSVAVVYRLSADTNYRHPLLPAVMVSTAAFFIYYAHEMRVYMMAVFFALLTITLYWHLTNPSKNSRSLKFGFVVCLAFLLHTHYVLALVAVALGLYHLFLTPWNQQKIALLFLFAIAALVALPWFGVTMLMAQRVASLNEPVSLAIIGRDVLYAFGNGLWVILPVLLALSFTQLRDKSIRFLWSLTILTASLSLAVNAVVGYLFHIRFLITLLPLLVMLAAVGLDVLAARTHRYVAIGVMSLWVVGGVWYSFDTRLMDSLHMHERMISLPTVEKMVDITEECVQDDDVVILYFEENLDREWINDLTFQYYFDGAAFRYTDLDTLQHLPTFFDDTYRSIRSVGLDKSAPYDERLQDFVADAPHVWLFIDPAVPKVDRLDEFSEIIGQQGYFICDSLSNDPTLEMISWGKSCDRLCE